MQSSNLKYILSLFSFFVCIHIDAQGITDYHTHLQDSALIKCLWKLNEQWHEPATAKDSVILDADSLVAQMNTAHIARAVILSSAYMFGAPGLNSNDEYEQVKNENDWVARQASSYPQRLKAYLSVNPLKAYALTEVKRCGLTGKFAGLKLHFTNSEVDLRDTAHIKKLQSVFKLADSLRLPITVHMRTLNDNYGATDASIFINQLLVHTKHVKVQVAHLAGWGGYDIATDAALGAFIDAFKKGIISRSRVFFDISAVLPQQGKSWTLDIAGTTQKHADWNAKDVLIKRLNAIGVSNILFGTDWPERDMKDYLENMKRTLGNNFSAQVLKNEML